VVALRLFPLLLFDLKLTIACAPLVELQILPGGYLRVKTFGRVGQERRSSELTRTTTIVEIDTM
jgi:hypothetical protein